MFTRNVCARASTRFDLCTRTRRIVPKFFCSPPPRSAFNRATSSAADVEPRCRDLDTSLIERPPADFLQIGNYSGSNEKMGCNDMIMLVTDGAPGFYKDIFKLYNKNRAVSFAVARPL